jgi:hypothetical protein
MSIAISKRARNRFKTSPWRAANGGWAALCWICAGCPFCPRPHFTRDQVAALVGTFRAAGFTQKQRLAVLYEHDVYGIIRDFTLFSREYGLQVQAFLDYEKATSWLSGKLEDTTEWRRGTPVPIAKRRPKKRPAEARPVHLADLNREYRKEVEPEIQEQKVAQAV